MTQALVAALMWALVISLLIVRRKRSDRSITYAAITIAVAMTLNDDSVYVAVDAVLGGTNIATLIADTLLMVGLFFLGRGVMHAGAYRPRLVRAAVSLPTLLVALAAIAVTFTLIDRGHTTTQFMADLGDQPAAATYSIINFLYCGIVVAAMLALAARQYQSTRGVARLPAALLILGSTFGVALCLTVLIMDISHVGGHVDLLHAVEPAYSPLSLLTFLFLCAGFTAQPVVRQAQRHARRRRTTALAAGLEPLWERATRARPALSTVEPRATRTDDPEGRLHRKIVEIRDAMIDGRVAFTTTDQERALLDESERHLLGCTQPDAAASVLRHGAPGEELASDVESDT